MESAFPMPDEAPVIMMDLFEKNCMFIFLRAAKYKINPIN
jgi:hypothetical protein